MLKIDNLNVSFGKKRVLKDVSFTLEKGEILGLLGPTASGKSTILRSISGLNELTSPCIKIFDTDVSTKTKNSVSLLTETNNIPLSFKVKDAVNFYKLFYNDFSVDSFNNLKESLELDFPMNKKVTTLSKGIIQLLRLILCLSRDVSLYILDEPFSGLDVLFRDKVNDLLLDVLSNEKSIIISSHLIHDIENIIDRAIFLKDGEILTDDLCDNIRENTGLSIEDAFKASMIS